MKDEARLYQVRMGAGETAGDLVVALTHAVWGTLAGGGGSGGPDPHRWAGLHDLVLGVLKGRLVHYPGCGEREECRMGLKSAAEGKPFPAEEWSGGTPVNTLEAGRDLRRLARLVAGLACRRFLPGRPSERRESVSRAAEAVEKVFQGRTYVSGACAECSARHGFRERRLWPVGPVHRAT
jgi:hypothetical protein